MRVYKYSLVFKEGCSVYKQNSLWAPDFIEDGRKLLSEKLNICLIKGFTVEVSKKTGDVTATCVDTVYDELMFWKLREEIDSNIKAGRVVDIENRMSIPLKDIQNISKKDKMQLRTRRRVS